MAGTLLQLRKFESTGNDFILIDNRFCEVSLSPADIAKMCHRRFGIGADGLILLEDDPKLSFSMRYFNSDGHEGSFCGNGGRAVAAFAGILEIPGFPAYRFMASDGVHTAELSRMEKNRWHVILKLNDTMVDRADLIDTGSPHHITYLKDLHKIDITEKGKALRISPQFGPGGCNVNFIEDKGDHLFVRTWERGVEAETLSCGTGVTASAIFHNLGEPDGEHTVFIKTAGGELKVEFFKTGNLFRNIRLSGTTTCVFSGNYYL